MDDLVEIVPGAFLPRATLASWQRHLLKQKILQSIRDEKDRQFCRSCGILETTESECRELTPNS